VFVCSSTYCCHCLLLQAEGTACVADQTCSGCTAGTSSYLDYSTVQECTQINIRAALGSREFLNSTACVWAAKNATSALSSWLDCVAEDALENSNCKLKKFCSTAVSHYTAIAIFAVRRAVHNLSSVA
jgi:hypothetical protein